MEPIPNPKKSTVGFDRQVEEISDSGEDDWDPVNTPSEAADILHRTIFEFGQVIYQLCLEDEKLNKKKYEGKSKPSVKIAVVTALMKCWDNNRERLAEHYVNVVLNWKEQIIGRNDRFFLENDHIFPRAPKEDIEFFRDLWRPNSTFHLSNDEKESVYEYFDIMIHYCEEWKKMKGYVAEWEKSK
jgi:hypothetical protein